MLPKHNRLTKKKDFERVFQKGRGFQEDSLYLKITKNNLKNSRFGFIISKKYSKKATMRNKVKRKLRAFVQAKLPQLKKGIDGVVVVIAIFTPRDLENLEKTTNKLFLKAGLL